MSTPLTDGINALTAYANEVTGASDTTLSDAVYTLAQEYNNGSYSDDVTDFSGGNIKALISHYAEYINTGYYPKSQCECVLYASKNTKYNDYEDYFGTCFSDGSRIGAQQYSYLTRVAWFAKSNSTFNAINSDMSTTTPVIIWARNIIGASGQTATRPLLIFNGYYNGNLDQLAGYNFYGLKCYEFGKLVKHYAPWLDNNRVPCIHELVDDEYFYNVGTGSFDYIDADGNTVTA